MSGDHNMYQNDFNPDWDTVKAFDERHAEDTALLRKALEMLEDNRDAVVRVERPQYMRDYYDPVIAALKERLGLEQNR
jgi:hypothetical protein